MTDRLLRYGLYGIVYVAIILLIVVALWRDE